MRRSRVSYNIHAQAVKDTPRLKKHLGKINPTAVLLMDGLGLAQDIHATLPDTVVIHRNYGITKGDDDVHKKVSPERWLDLRAVESSTGIWLYTTNEPAFDTETIDWHVRLMERCVVRGVRLVVGNWGVGNPGADDWNKAKRMLELLAEHPELFILGLHEYGCGVMTSGLYGGYPDHAGVQPGELGGKNLIPSGNWPASLETPEHITTFHCGRFRFLLNYCSQAKIKPPRIILTEHGMDDVSDIKPWAERLIKTSPYKSIRSWKSLLAQWRAWFPLWSIDRAYFEQLQWADRVIYQNSPVEAQLVYCWGHSSDDWEQFDVAEADEFQALMEAADVPPVSNLPPVVTQPAPAPAPKPKPIGLPVFPANFSLRARDGFLSGPAPSVNIRELPTAQSRSVGQLTNQALPGKYIPEDELAPDEAVIDTVGTTEAVWIPIDIGTVQGWVFGAYLQITPTQIKQVDKQRVKTRLEDIRRLLDEIVIEIGD